MRMKKYSIYKQFAGFLKSKQVMEKSINTNLSSNDASRGTYIYVLGGNQESLIHRFRKASTLYHHGIPNKILILSRPGITEYSPDLGRNLTNVQWAIRELEKLNVRKGDIEPVFVSIGLLETLNEAIDLLDIAGRKRCERLVLVTSGHHTRRAYDTFSGFQPFEPIDLHVYGASSGFGLRGVITEYIKLVIYDAVVVPVCRWKRNNKPQRFSLFHGMATESFFAGFIPIESR
jgi:hypothetical protein